MPMPAKAGIGTGLYAACALGLRFAQSSSSAQARCAPLRNSYNYNPSLQRTRMQPVLPMDSLKRSRGQEGSSGFLLAVSADTP